MCYYTLYNYSIKEDPKLIFPSNTACFSTLFGLKPDVEEVNIFLFKNNKSTSFTQHHNIYSAEDIEIFFKSFEDIGGIVPEIYNLTENQLYEEVGGIIEDLKEYGLDTTTSIKLHFNFKESTKIIIKLMCTLTRYLYEEEYNYKELVNNYINFIRQGIYNIPNIELFQLCHSNHVTHAGHMLIGSYNRTHKTIPVKQQDIIENLTKRDRINDVFYCKEESTKDVQSIENIITEYINQNE